ncbi:MULTISPECIES: hypothetical protein [Vibrio]|uniref:hypothetical protein n=1 Tax=Vibrio TaxID=662 RepID=UPI0014822741|nr:MULTISPECIES: hypothetical protein [Vibrio]MDQ2164981.1 hypothetical protein [Vibrio anguillarum]MDQ2189848.1 hypothetical protein [Vibrio sp. A14(2019)]MDQ2198025.1 hypothetical protein [Vibrio sp. 2017_1457_11]NNN77092.1 hypothetical protein [Vibrio sp. B7]NNN93924.1 hypothetical protein [Vibrio sp. B8-1]
MFRMIFLARTLPLFVLCITFFSTVNAAVITKQLHVSTVIDKKKFHSQNFTKLEFFPNNLTAFYNKGIDTFHPLQTSLYIETDIPDNQVNTSYQIILTDNQSQCHTAAESVLELSDKFVDVEIDGKNLAINEGIQVGDFKSSKNDFKHSIHDFKLLFAPLPEVTQFDDYLLRCSGSISVRLEFTI